ncbi:hypothetical protein N7V53_16860 [Kosakonia sp. HypNH10]|nr:hypothetical protein [Kosakonia sp. HypNH10]MDH2914179.1 hypothetical protein [Kosakonia sp. HypNH10]
MTQQHHFPSHLGHNVQEVSIKFPIMFFSPSTVIPSLWKRMLSCQSGRE